MDKYFKELIKYLKQQKLSKNKITSLKIKLCKKHGIKKIPTDIEVLMHAKESDIPKLKQLQTKPTRSQSGVAVVAIMSKPIKCHHGSCIMCPSNVDSGIPQSYTGKEPATRRAIRNNFDPYLQVFNRLEQYIVSDHVPEKVELIIMGGTFPSFPKDYQEEFVTYAFKAMNDFSDLFFTKSVRNSRNVLVSQKHAGRPECNRQQCCLLLTEAEKPSTPRTAFENFNFLKFKKFFELPGEVGDEARFEKILSKVQKLKNKKTALEKEQLKNETSKIRCIGMTIETRADYGKLKEGNEMLRLGATRVELGVQSVYDDVLKVIERGHTTKDTIESIRTLKDLGFKINAHYMPGLPGLSRKKDLEGMKQLFSNPDYRPDMLKIYPCMVIPNTKLEKMYKEGKFKPLSTEEAAELIAEFKPSVPKYVRIMRVQRDIPTNMTIAGVDRTNLRQYISQLKSKCNCIRCREPKGKPIGWKNVKILTEEYNASKGKEFFISAEDTKNNILIGFCRLRFPSQQLRKEIIEDSALIRELHVYGETTSIGEKGSIQHRGFGKKLLKAAETIAKKNKKNKIIVISGIGAREYYRKLSYEKEGGYMVKKI